MSIKWKMRLKRVTGGHFGQNESLMTHYCPLDLLNKWKSLWYSYPTEYVSIFVYVMELTPFNQKHKLHVYACYCQFLFSSLLINLEDVWAWFHQNNKVLYYLIKMSGKNEVHQWLKKPLKIHNYMVHQHKN